MLKLLTLNQNNMTPKEKSEELVNKFNYENKHFFMLDSKKCALLCVDEIIKSGCTLPSNNSYYGCNEEASGYWLKVKSELEKL